MVLVFHVVVGNHWLGFPTEGWTNIFRHGWAGVDLFFVISGFVITLSATSGCEQDPLGFRRPFLQRRLARIAPLYWLTGLVYLVLVNPSLLNGEKGSLMARLLSHVLFLQNLHPLTHGSLNGPSWSAAAEMQFYLLMAVLAPWLLRMNKFAFLTLSFLVAGFYRLAVILALPPGQSDPLLQFVYMTQLPGMWEEFAMGIFIALTVRAGANRKHSWLSVGWRNSLIWGFAAAAAFWLAVYIAGVNVYWHTPWMLLLWRPLIGGGFAFVVCFAITLPHAAHRHWKPLRYWGDISYGLYLWHFLVITALTGMAAPIQGARLLLYVLVLTTLLSIASWHLVEQPNIERFKRTRS